MKEAQTDIANWFSFKQGDKEAFAELFSAYYPLLYQYGSKFCNNGALLQDTIQDLFVELWQSKSGTEVKSVRAYLLKSLKYKLYKQARRSKTVLQPSETSFEDMGFSISHEDLLIATEEERSKVIAVANAVNQLPARQKEMVYLKTYKGLQYEEICEIMDINYQVARNLFSTALKTLRQLLLPG